MKMSHADIASYPKFSKYVRFSLPQVIKVPAIVRAMQTIGQLNKATLTRALTWGSDPSIKVVALAGEYGEFTPDVHSNEIRINSTLVADFEAGRDLRAVRGGHAHLAGITVLHEMIHWGDDQDGIDRPGEEGEEFERLIYGAVIG